MKKETEPQEYADPVAQEVRDACARLLFLDAWASAIERGECPACGAVDADAGFEGVEGVEGLADALRDGDPCPACGRDVPRAGAGDDWADVLADLDTPREAFVAADRVVEGLGGEVGTLDALRAWAYALQGLRPEVDVEVEVDVDVDACAERFGTLLGFEALGHGVGLGDDLPSDGRRVVEVAQVPAAWAVEHWDGSTYTLESSHPSREAAVEALRATRYTRPRVPSVDFGAYAFDGGALLACSPGCEGIVAGEHGVESCGACGGDDDARAAVHFGRLLAGRGLLGDAFRLLRGEVVVEPRGAVLDRCADGLLGGPPPDPSALLAGVVGDLLALADEVRAADDSGRLDRVVASLRALARTLGGAQ